MARAATPARSRDREFEDDRGTRTTPRGNDTVMVGGMDDLVAGADEREEEHEPVVLSKDPPERRVVADVEDGPENDQDEERDARLAYDDSEQDDDSSRGVSRRQRRNRARREVVASSQAEIAALRQQLGQLAGMVGHTMQGQVGVALQTVEGQIGAAQQALQLADAELGRAVESQNGQRFIEVQQLRDEAMRRVMLLGGQRQRLIQEAQGSGQQAPQPQRQQSGRPAPDPKAVKLSQVFMDRHEWFDPNGTDEDSTLVKAIDETLEVEGYNPSTPMYWRELERRVKRRGIGESSGDDQDRDNGGMPPTNSRRSSRRPGTKGFNLDPQMREHLETEGLLEPNLAKEDLARRDRLIRGWRDMKGKADRGELRKT